jgi:HD-GYP domain-containing protein (c-di-GMP phosphodiesterase class II)
VPKPTPEGDDPVLSALHEAESRYRLTLREFAERADEVARLRSEVERLGLELATRQSEGERLRQRVEHEAERAAALASALKDIHRALFSGNIYDLVLRACMTLTGATRGEYLTVTSADGPLHVRARVEIEHAPGSPLTEFFDALCREVLQRDQVLVRNDIADVLGPSAGDQAVRNCMAAPVVLRGSLSGVIVVADKPSGDFLDHDAHVLLSVGSQAAVALENARMQREIQEAYLSIVGVMAEAISARGHPLAAEHRTASRYALAVAQRLGLPEYQQSVVYYATVLHDIGNIGVSDGVLNKPGPLMEAERELIRAHAQIGHDLLRQVPIFGDVAHAIRHHHERYDGQGYPGGLQGEAIPIAARIVGVVGAYSAMLAPRSYRPALSPEDACLELRRGAGTQFDAAVVDALLASLASSAPPEAVNGGQTDFVALPGLETRVSEPAVRS